jgi:hypothetical protein
MLRLWLAMGVGVAFLIGSGVVASMAKAQPSADPAAVITAYEMARNRQDIDTALSFFADDATITQRTTIYSGKDEIRKFLDGVATRSRFVVVSDRRTIGNQVSWTERSGGPGPGPAPQSAGPRPLQAQAPQVPQGPNGAPATSNAVTVTVEAVVQDGKIHSLSYMSGIAPARTDPSLDGRAQLPASVGLGAVLVVLLGVVMVASVGFGRARTGASTLQGRLMEDLQGWSAARQ